MSTSSPQLSGALTKCTRRISISRISRDFESGFDIHIKVSFPQLGIDRRNKVLTDTLAGYPLKMDFAMHSRDVVREVILRIIHRESK